MVNEQQEETLLIKAAPVRKKLVSKKPKETEQPEYEKPTKKRKEIEHEDSTASTVKKDYNLAKRNIGSQDKKKRKEHENEEDSTPITVKKEQETARKPNRIQQKK
ncbi:hypothetical protein C5167_018594 [Papaver somniferum]|uniref:Uncharacterized protein n=1 Tax=Papaver somniferum TaxID=3469 RepID=A0A4Y7IPX3_PAPSO|nr:hypothetical protein C5167_018594 [Papaver somniferum]